MKSKQNLDLLLMDLKESVFAKMCESFFQGGMAFLGTKGDCVWLMFKILGKLLLRKLKSTLISIHLGSTKCTRILESVLVECPKKAYLWNLLLSVPFANK